jgi:hypothetical protein
MESKGGIGLGGLIIIGLLIWWFFIRVDYRDVWWNGTEYQTVRNCGNLAVADCQNANVFYTPVKHVARNGDIHTFVINFDNGGYVTTEGTCMKDESHLYNVERYCLTTTVNPDDYGNHYKFLITKL